MEIKKEEVTDILGAINSQCLKAKRISPANILKLLALKKELVTYAREMQQNEKALFDMYSNKENEPPEFKKQLEEIQSKTIEPKNLNFLSEREIEWTENADSSYALVVMEFLAELPK